MDYGVTSKQDAPINATDLTFNTGSGGLGLGSDPFASAPAPGTDILPGATIGQTGTLAAPSFNTGSNQGANPIGTPQSPYAAASPGFIGSAAPNAGPLLTGTTPAGTFSLTDTGNIFARAFVILTGLVFLAVGLTMLRTGTVPTHPRELLTGAQ